MKSFFKPLRNKYFWRGTILLSLWLLLVIVACNVQVNRKTVKALIKKGIPETSILMDYAGCRTLDSVVRAKTVFGKERFMIISQHFHNERALYLAEYNHIKAVGFNAQDVTAYYGLKTRVREYLARLKLFIDLWFEVNPKFLK